MGDIKYKLYSLSDETDVRYIGITKQKLSYRLSAHLSSCKQAFKNKKSRHHRHCWIKSLLDKDTKPIISLMAEFNSSEEAKQAEINTIKLFNNLVNGTAGGDGIREYKFSEEYLETKRFKVDQYDLYGNLLATFKSLSEASLVITGTEKHNGKISAVTKGKHGRRTAFGYVWRIHNEPFDKYPVTPQINITEAQKKALSKRQLENNVMKGRLGLQNPTSKPVLILNTENVILNIAESVRDVTFITKLSKSCVTKMLKMNKEVASYKLVYANEDIVQSLQKCKSSTLTAFVGQIYA
jgi:predicted GIY-YIG superfamily endonuclease